MHTDVARDVASVSIRSRRARQTAALFVAVAVLVGPIRAAYASYRRQARDSQWSAVSYATVRLLDDRTTLVFSGVRPSATRPTNCPATRVRFESRGVIRVARLERRRVRSSCSVTTEPSAVPVRPDEVVIRVDSPVPAGLIVSER